MSGSPPPFAGKIAVVVGGASGIGSGLCRRLAAGQATVELIDLDEAGAGLLVAELNAMGGVASAYVADVTQPSALAAAESALRRRRSRIDYLFVNAGGLSLAPFLETSNEDWRWLFELNVIGAVNVVRAFLPGLLAQSTPSRICITSSLSMLRTAEFAGQTIYVATKAAQFGFFAALERELHGANVSLSTIFPGSVQTNLKQRSEQARAGSIRLAVPTKAAEQMMSPDEAGEIILEGVLSGRRYITTHPGQRHRVEATFSEILSAF